MFQIAAEGDPAAVEAVRWTGDELGHLAIAVMRQLKLGHAPFDLVLAGSYFKGSPLVIEALRARVMTESTQARYIHLEAPPVTGAVLLGMEMHGLPSASVQKARSRLQMWNTAQPNAPVQRFQHEKRWRKH